MNGWKDFWAGVEIFFSNFNARFGWLVPLLLFLVIGGSLFWALVRTVLSGRDLNRCPSPYKTRRADEHLTARAAESLAQAVAIPTVTGDREGIDRLNAWIRERYAGLLEQVSCAETDSGSLVLRWRAAEKSDRGPALFCGHLDVVPPGTGWTEEPFSGARRDSMICGRGAVDCKATVVALLEACDALRREGFAPRRDLYFAFGSDEETGGTQGAARIAEQFSKRGLHFELVLGDGGFIAENHLDRVEHAAALIGVGEKRSCAFRLTATAAGGHSSTPPCRTAPGALCEAMCRIESVQPRHRLSPLTAGYLRASLPAMTFGKRFAVCNMPFSRPILTRVFRSEPRVLALMRSTAVPTQLAAAPAPNILPVTAEGVVSARLLPGEKPEEMLDHLRALVADLPLRVELLDDWGGGPVADRRNPMFALLASTVKELYPRMPVLATLCTGATGSRHYANLADCTLRFAPLVLSARENAGVHGADECLSEQSLGLAVETYMNLMKKL